MVYTMAVCIAIYFIVMAIVTYIMLSITNSKRINSQLGNDAFPTTKSGRKIIWRLKMSYLVEACGIAMANFVIALL